MWGNYEVKESYEINSQIKELEMKREEEKSNIKKLDGDIERLKRKVFTNAVGFIIALVIIIIINVLTGSPITIIPIHPGQLSGNISGSVLDIADLMRKIPGFILHIVFWGVLIIAFFRLMVLCVKLIIEKKSTNHKMKVIKAKIYAYDEKLSIKKAEMEEGSVPAKLPLSAK